MVGDVDTCCLAVAHTFVARYALVGIDHRSEHRPARQQAQKRPDGADRIAVRTAVAPCQHRQHHNRNYGYDERADTLDPHLTRIEGVAADTLRQICEQVVAPSIHGSEEVRCNTAERAVRGQNTGHTAHTANQCGDEDDEYRISQHLALGRVTVTVLTAHLAETGNDILKYAQRTYHRAIHTPQKKREDYQHDHHAQIQRQNRGQQLYLGDPPQPEVRHAAHVNEQQRCGQYHQNGQYQPHSFQYRHIYPVL